MAHSVPPYAVVDCETMPRRDRPDYPPAIVGVAVSLPGGEPRYYAFGHPTRNNCTADEARQAVAQAYQCENIVFHNANFDIECIEKHFKLFLSTTQVHDTMHMLFLHDPSIRAVGLKDAAEKLLGEKPTERDELVDWLVGFQPIEGITLTHGPKSKHYAGAYVAYAPGDLAGQYAIGDVTRTAALFEMLYQDIENRGMFDAYKREQALRPVLSQCESDGLCVDVKKLARDAMALESYSNMVDVWLQTELGGNEINFNSGEQLANALLSSGKCRALPKTARGDYKTDKETIISYVTDKRVAAMLRYRAQAKTCLGTFIKPWLEMAHANRGRIYTRWHQVRGNDNGARTGRLSSSPNLQNIPKEFTPLFKEHDINPEASTLPASPLLHLPRIPLMREYIVPSIGCVLIDRDYSQQEIRILAHFAGGDLLAAYQANPWLDIHDYARDKLAAMGLHYERRQVKNTNFGLIYGMGASKLAIQNGTSVEDAAKLKRAVLSLYPGLAAMYDEMRTRAKACLPIRTWGGRLYHCEPPRISGGKVQEFDYKMVNVLIQGSAADCTKQAIVSWDLHAPADWRLLINVHDELLCEVPAGEWKEAMQVLKESMESVEFDLPMLTEGSMSSENWGSLIDTDRKGKQL